MRGLALSVAALVAMAPSQAPLTVKQAARALEPGELVVLTLTSTQPIDSLRVRAFDRDALPYRVAENTWQVLVGLDLDVQPGRHAVSFEATTPRGAERVSHDLNIRKKAFRTRTLNVDEAFVNPPASVQQRIADDAQALARCWAEGDRSRLWTGAFVRPVPHEANSAFGSRSIFNGQARAPHSGADFLSPAGTRVMAPNAGRVALARDLYYSGNTVVIDHGVGVFSLLAHLSAITVNAGDAVAAGDAVGRVGATGRVTGAHLHWTVRVGAARVDPLSLLAVLGRTAGSPDRQFWQ